MNVLKKSLKLFKEKISLKNSLRVGFVLSLVMHSCGAVVVYKHKIPPKPETVEFTVKKKSDPSEIAKKRAEVDQAELERRQGELDKAKKDRLNRDKGRIIPKGLKAFVQKMLAKKGEGFYGIGIYDGAVREVMINGELMYGVIVSHVVEGYPADLAGIMDGDIIVMCDGHWGITSNDYIRGSGPTPITVVVYRAGRLIELHFERGWISEERTNRAPGPQSFGP